MADQVGEKINHVKVGRRRWYDDAKWKDNTKPPEDAPEWSVSQSYNPNEENENCGRSCTTSGGNTDDNAAGDNTGGDSIGNTAGGNAGYIAGNN